MKTFVAKKRSRLFWNVFAEESTTPITPVTPEATPEPTPTPTPEPSTPKPSGSVNFEDLVKQAREQEKGKLYPQIEKLKEDKNNLLLVVQERDNKIADLEKQLKKATDKTSQLSKDLEDGTATNKTVSELTLQVTTLERQLEDLQVQYETDVNNLQLTSYKEKKIAEAQGQLIPELVTGNTEDEINEAIELAKTRYAEITQQAVSVTQQQLPPANPSASTIQIGKDLSFEQMQSMSPSEWAEARKQMGLK